MTKYPINLAPGASVTVETQGSFLYFESASAGGLDTSIKVIIPGAKGGEVILQVGQGFKLDVDYERLFVSNNLGQGTIIGQLVIADGNFFDHRVIGTVSVVDGGKNRTLSGAAFILAGYQAAVAAQISAVQAFNPATSTKNMVVEKLYLSSATAQIMKIGYNNVANGAYAGPAQSKKIGATSSLGQLVVSSAAGNPAGFVFLAQLQVQASQTLVMEFREPIVFPPGYGLNILTGAVNTDVNATFEFYEDPV